MWYHHLKISYLREHHYVHRKFHTISQFADDQYSANNLKIVQLLQRSRTSHYQRGDMFDDLMSTQKADIWNIYLWATEDVLDILES